MLYSRVINLMLEYQIPSNSNNNFLLFCLHTKTPTKAANVKTVTQATTPKNHTIVSSALVGHRELRTEK
jgi:hypothetical protein